MQSFLEKYFNKKKKSISPLIASILLIVVAISIIVIILSWGRSVTDESLDFTELEIYDKSNLDGFLKQNTRMLTNNLILENLHSSQPITIVGYKIHSKEDAFYLNKYLYLEEDFNLPSITILPNQMEELYMVCFPESDFLLELILDDDTYLTINIRNNNFNLSKCSQYTALFFDYDETILKTETLDYGEDATAPSDPTRLGYTFSGWSPSDFTNITEDTNFIAEYNINQYTITFNSAGGTTVDPITQDYNTSVTAPNDPTKEGHSFNDWDPVLPEYMPAENVEHTAQWTVNQYTLTYSAGPNGSVTGDLSQTVNHGEDGTEVTAVPDAGYIFSTWSDGVLTESRTDENVTEDITVTAEFEEELISCPEGWALVPNDPEFNTGDFCVMKWEAKMDASDDGLGNYPVGDYSGCVAESTGNQTWHYGNCSSGNRLVSTPQGSPIARINQTDAIAACQAIGAQLLTNDHWMTIARNVSNNPDNWADKTIGSTVSSGGGLFRGNVNLNDSASCGSSNPLDGLTAGTNCIVNNEHHTDRNKRVLILSNGEEIWDLAGNVRQWTSDVTDTNSEAPYRFLDNGDFVTDTTNRWYDYSLFGGSGYYISYLELGSWNLGYKDLFLLTSGTYNANHGVGRIYLRGDATQTNRAFLRGGSWSFGTSAGVLSLRLDSVSSSTSSSIGLRCFK